MNWTRREAIVALGVGSGLAGCNSVSQERKGTRRSSSDESAGYAPESTTDDSATSTSDTATHFENGRLTAPVDNATVRSDTVQTDGVTMYLDPDGDDDADGLTRETAKETLHAAVRDAPLHGNGMERLLLDLAPGRYTDEGRSNLDLRDASVPAIHIRGETDDDGEPKVTVDGGEDSYTISVQGNCYVSLENLKATGAIQTVGTHYGAKLGLYNVDVRAGTKTKRTAYVTHGSTLVMDEHSTMDLTPSEADTNWGLQVNGNASAKLFGAIRAQAPSAVIAKETAWIFLASSAVVDGANGVDQAVRVHKHSNAKIDGPTIRNAPVGVLGGVNSTVSVRSEPTFAGVEDEYQTRIGAVFEDVPRKEGWIHLPSNKTPPDTNRIYNPVGMQFLDSTDNVLKLRGLYPSGYVDAQLWTEVDSGTVEVPAGGTATVAETPVGAKPGELTWTIAEPPAEPVELQKTLRADPDGERTEWVIRETAGDAAVSVTYTLSRLESYRLQG
jgi:catechol 2,3-dioxygenase-like lactoylglutathione lyase family enzyme